MRRINWNCFFLSIRQSRTFVDFKLQIQFHFRQVPTSHSADNSIEFSLQGVYKIATRWLLLLLIHPATLGSIAQPNRTEIEEEEKEANRFAWIKCRSPISANEWKEFDWTDDKSQRTAAIFNWRSSQVWLHRLVSLVSERNPHDNDIDSILRILFEQCTRSKKKIGNMLKKYVCSTGSRRLVDCSSVGEFLVTIGLL